MIYNFPTVTAGLNLDSEDLFRGKITNLTPAVAHTLVSLLEAE